MKKLFINIIFFLSVYSCKEKYIPSVQSTGNGYLVVEGFINGGSDPSTITLTRSIKLYDTATIVYEHNAAVNIEGENQENFPLYENGNGTYISGSLNLSTNEKYRLHIKTQNGEEYLSDFVQVKTTPPIDSISWQRENGGLTIYVSTHNSQSNIGYYRWDYEETWEIHSAYTSNLLYYYDPFTNAILGVDYRNPDHRVDSSIYRCWRSSVSSNINLGSSEKLTSDIIYLPLLHIAGGDQKLSVLYSINVKQYSLSREGYNFYQALEQNTEQLGTIFDPLPTILPSNIHCINNPAEVVVGYVDISTRQNFRIFISNASLPGWNFYTGCQLFVLDNNADSLKQYGYGTLPTAPHNTVGLNIVDFYASSSSCVDCTTSGTNVKPIFWP